MILVGFMGSGKTTLGKAVANSLGKVFIDLDDYIVEESGTSINSIFSDKGEEGFREIEFSALKSVIENTDAVISTGGGIITYESTRELLKRNDNHKVYYLDAPFEHLYTRIKDDTSRPMLKKGYEATRALYEYRMGLYEEVCDHQVDASLTQTEVQSLLLRLENSGQQ